MQKIVAILYLSFLIFFATVTGLAQEKKDSPTVFSMNAATQATIEKKFSPRKATILSAVLPGAGQAYNKKYWKIPIIYAALGVTAGVFIYNIQTYNGFKTAYRQSVIDSGIINNPNIAPDYRIYSQASLLANRNLFRQNIDYSVLFFLLFWGLNVVDATVDAHLKAFDVNDNISLQFKPGYSNMANTNGVSLVMNIGKRY
ncbi:MAG: hypothetical protein HY305_02010 [Sphingobacteriales bacterium]|nr:hypothetical protein [Sphingobacteriales bacterium]